MSGEVLTERSPVARKRHTCDLCLRAIEPGTRYRYYTVAADGSLWTNHEHEDCAWLVWHEWQCDGDDLVDFQEVRAELDARALAASPPMTEHLRDEAAALTKGTKA